MESATHYTEVVLREGQELVIHAEGGVVRVALAARQPENPRQVKLAVDAPRHLGVWRQDAAGE